MTGLHNTTDLVTRADIGSGASIAKSPASHSATVIITYLQKRETTEQVLKDIKAGGTKGMLFQAEVL